MKLLYGRIPESDILHKFHSELPRIGQKLSMNLVWSGKVNRFNRHKTTHPFHKISAGWVGGSINVVSDLVEKTDARTGRKKKSRKSRTVYGHGKIKIEGAIELWFVYKFKTRPLDSGNCQAMSKVFEDGLVRCGMIGNDTNAFVTWVGNLALPMTSDERDGLEKDEVEVYILKSSVNDERSPKGKGR